MRESKLASTPARTNAMGQGIVKRIKGPEHSIIALMQHPKGGFGSRFTTRHSFAEAYNFVGPNGTTFVSVSGMQFSASQGEAEDGSPTIVFKGHGNVCRACWGFRKSCSRTGIGRCSEALDSAF